MKKGDTVQRREEIPEGKSLMHGFETVTKAEAALASIGNFYTLPMSAEIIVDKDVLNPGCFALVARTDTYITVEAKVNWVVEAEVALTYPNGGSVILDTSLEENSGWVVIKSVAPTYQSNVEHMSDDELRASIDAMRNNRVARPAKVKKTRTASPRQPAMSAEDKKLSAVLGALSPEARLALQQKLGMVD